MSFNRLKYDSKETKKYNSESIGPGNYLYDTPIMCTNCYNDNPRIINQKNGVSINSNVDWRFYYGPVDVESDLFNLNRNSTNMYVPNSEVNSNNQVLEVDKKNPLRNNLVDFKRCFFNTEDTRLSNPAENLRGTGWNRFDPLLCKNPQENVTFPGTYNIPTRTITLDNHRPVVVIPKIDDMNPNEKMRECPKIDGNVCGNFTNPLYQYDVCG